MNGGSVKIKLVGGLGNQLFIWATAFVIQKKHNYKLSFDASACEQWGCELESFGINIDLKPLRITGNLPGNSSNHVIVQTLRSLRSKSRKLRIGKNFWEKNSSFDPTVFNIKPGKVLCGYFQSYKYFLGFENEIRKHLTQGFLGGDEYSKLLTRFDGNYWVAIHVRRQDYALLSETFGLTTERYFVDALKYIESVFPGAKKVVFSDDISEARKLLPNCEFYIGKSDLPSSVETLILMSKSSAIIGSNSSFSWWAAFLSEASDHNKIFPSPWFRDRAIDTSDLVPPSWHRIKNSAD